MTSLYQYRNQNTLWPKLNIVLISILISIVLGSFSMVPVRALELIETPILAEQVNTGTLPSIAERLPMVPLIVTLNRPYQSLGHHGGTLRLLMAKARDTRQLYVYGYARLIGVTPELTFEPDIVESIDVHEGHQFTFNLRPGHRWSDGHPFTSEDFRYWWEEIANNPELRPFGPPSYLQNNGEYPTVEIIDPVTVRYSWSQPNPNFLPYLAGARPEPIYAPAHYLKQFNPRYTAPEILAQRITDHGQTNWQRLHNRLDNLNRFDNPDLPVLQPWVVTNRAPTERFIFERNPYYHRIDDAGRQLPYIDRIMMILASSKIIAAKTGAGESDLQARYLRFDDYTFLKQGEQRNNYQVHLWRSGSGAHLTLFPNLNVADPVWQTLLRKVEFRRALSLAINREEINQVIYYGLARVSNNTVLSHSPLFDPRYHELWIGYDRDHANRLLDQIGLVERNFWGLRLMPDGKPLEIIIESAGESTEETDVLQLISDSWLDIGIKVFIKPLQREVLRNRIYAGQTVMSISRGVDNGMPLSSMSPREFVPIMQAQYQWPKWGQYYQTNGQSGESPDISLAQELLTLYGQWQSTMDPTIQTNTWQRILEIHAQQQYTIGLIADVRQPVVVSNTLRNIPVDGLYNYDPGAYFGIYRPETFWFEQEERAK